MYYETQISLLCYNVLQKKMHIVLNRPSAIFNSNKINILSASYTSSIQYKPTLTDIVQYVNMHL